jgi:hypothetical protein
MKIRRVLLLIAGIWELLRFCGVFLAVWIVFRQTLETNRQGTYWLLLLGNGGLLVAASLLVLYLDPPRFRVLLNLVRLGKILGLFSALLLIVLEPAGTSLLTVGLLPYRIAPFSMLLVVSVADLIFLFLLLSYQIDEPHLSPPGVKEDEQESSLPEYRETILPPPPGGLKKNR